MRAYIDKSNLLSFVESKEHPLYGDCLRMLKSQFDLHFNFPRSSLSVCEELRSIIPLLTSGSKDAPMPVFNEQLFPSRPLKSNFYTDLTTQDLTAVYLLDDEKIDGAKSKGHILIGCKGEEVDVLSKLFFEEYQYTKSFNPRTDMPNWGALKPTVLPCTDIILADRYVFSDENLLKCNLCELLSEIGGRIKEKKINIVIFTNQEYTNAGKRYTHDLEKLKNEIRQHLKNVFEATPNITIVSRCKFHDRMIFTNYNHSCSGDSLTYYDSKGNIITNCSNYAVHSHGLRENLKRGFNLIAEMQTEINELTSLSDKECIIGDRKSNFLSFPD